MNSLTTACCLEDVCPHLLKILRDQLIVHMRQCPKPYMRQCPHSCSREAEQQFPVASLMSGETGTKSLIHSPCNAGGGGGVVVLQKKWGGTFRNTLARSGSLASLSALGSQGVCLSGPFPNPFSTPKAVCSSTCKAHSASFSHSFRIGAPQRGSCAMLKS